MEFNRAVLSHADRDRLRRFISAHELRLTRERDALALLSARVEGAHVVDPPKVPPECVTMHSQIRLHDHESGRAVITTVTLPLDVQVETDAPLLRTYPTALLIGACEGDAAVLSASPGQRRGRIDKVLFQPESAARRARKAARHGRLPLPNTNTNPRIHKSEEARSCPT